MTVSTYPSHVAAERVFDHDIYRRVHNDGDFHSWFADLHRKGYPDIFWTTANEGHWLVSRGDVLNDVLTKPDLFSSSVGIVPKSRQTETLPFPIALDPPEHTKYRAVLTGAFSPKAVLPLGDKARALTNQLLDGFYANGECDFMAEVSRKLPIAIFMDMVGLPGTDADRLLEFVDEMIRPTKVDSNEAAENLTAYAYKTVLERQANPGTDLLSDLTKAEVDGDRLTTEQLAGMTILLLLGGLDTVASVLGFTMNYLARNADIRHALAEHPETIAKGVEELLRRFPVSSLGRIVTRDAEFHGVQLKAGDMVITPTMAHSLDDRLYPNPTQVDFSRKPGFNGTFGAGAHRCLGSMLARVELRAFLEEWLRRMPDFKVKAGVDLVVETGMVVALKSLPLEWQVRP